MGIEELVAIAKRRGLSAISVTDHDTTAGATRAVIIGKRQQVQVIHGVEFSTMDTKRGRKAHLLCYLCDTPDRLEGMCRRTGESRKKAAMEMVRKVMRYYPITPELIVKCATGSTNIYKQHGLALVEAEYPETREGLELIHSAGGVAVLAHPPVYQSDDLLEELADNGLDGVEVWHPRHTDADVQKYTAFAKQRGLLMTGGSDFHGMYTAQSRPLGSTAAPDECTQALLAYKNKMKKLNA